MTSSRTGALTVSFVIVGIAVAVGVFVAIRGDDLSSMRVGTVAPAFERPDLQGRSVALDRLRGRVVFVNFWATWCAPCRSEAPSLEKLYRKLRGERFEIVALSIDESESFVAVRDFVKEFELSFPVLLDQDQKIYQEYAASGVPETFMVDPRGRIVERFIGPRDWSDPRYANAILKLAAQEAGADPTGG